MGTLAGKTIMVVEDEPEIGYFTKAVLEDEGARAVLATTSREAIALLRRVRPDLMLLDAMLPDGDGCAVAEAMRSRFSGEVPVIMMSAVDAQRGAAFARQIQAIGFIEKPFDLDDLLAAIGRGLRASPVRTEARRGADNVRSTTLTS